jgi:hypothetical protein
MLIRNKLNIKSAPFWSYYTDILGCTVNTTLRETQFTTLNNVPIFCKSFCFRDNQNKMGEGSRIVGLCVDYILKLVSIVLCGLTIRLRHTLKYLTISTSATDTPFVIRVYTPAGISLRRPRFSLWLVHVEFWVENGALKLERWFVPPSSPFYQTFLTHSTIYLRERCIISATESVENQHSLYKIPLSVHTMNLRHSWKTSQNKAKRSCYLEVNAIPTAA